ncbi:Seed maturation protein [Parasponia andersonii]|uniref:Seed maturation protein n=1 Tax=Parasponia andersonii TaxID=3476 RepID=A0A2P5C2K9_PARAD|nr:Seed maturation protein [Parasponia andersonii]
MRAIGISLTQPGGIGAVAQSAATQNTRVKSELNKTTISDVLGDTTKKVPADKAVTREDAEGVIGAEIRNKPDILSTTPGGVAASIAAAARLNQNK